MQIDAISCVPCVEIAMHGTPISGIAMCRITMHGTCVGMHGTCVGMHGTCVGTHVQLLCIKNMFNYSVHNCESNTRNVHTKTLIKTTKVIMG